MKSLPAALLVSLLSSSALGAPIISPELGLDQPVFGPAWKDQVSPAVAHDGMGGTLVVWADHRRAGHPTADIYAARVDSTGTVLDPGGILVSSSPGTVGSPAVTHNGQTFMVVWHGANGGKLGARVSPGGKVLDRPALELSPTLGGSRATDLAHSKGVYLLVWREGSSDSSIVGALVNSAGKLLQKVNICDASGPQRNPRVAANDAGIFWVVWQDYRSGKHNHTYGGRVTAGGKVLDPGGIPISTTLDGQYLPSVTFGGGSFLVAWHTNSDIHGARVSAAGKVLDTKGLDICVNKNIRMAPAVAYGGGKNPSFLVVWKDFRNGAETDIYGTRVSATGKVLETKGFGISEAAGIQDTPRVAGGAKGFFVAWADYRNQHDANIFGTPVDPAGKVLDKAGTLVSSSANHQAAPDVTSDASGYLVMWQDLRQGTAPFYRADIHGARLSAAGKAQDPKGITVFSSTRDEVEPVVAHDGKDALVAWRSRWSASGKEHLLGARISLPAKVSKPLTLDSALPQKLGLALARGKGLFLLGWYTPTLGSVKLARVDSSGKVLGGLTAGSGQSPAMAYGGGGFLVVWGVDQQCPGEDPGTSCILGLRVSPEGKLLGPGKPMPLSTRLKRRYEDPAVAWDGTRYLVVWADNRNGSFLQDPATDIYGVRVDTAGSRLDAADIAICTAKDIQRGPAVVHDGKNFVVAWEDLRRHQQEDIYGGRVSSNGAVPDPGGFVISGEATRELTPRLASNGAGQSMVVYARYDDSPTTGSQRVRGRLVTWDPLDDGFPCSNSMDCKSLHCVDGVCCDKACGGGSLLDCQACSGRRGAAKDGVCGPVKADQVCRKQVSWDVCDVAERCDGASLACPPDIKQPDGYPCSGGTCQKGLCLSLPDAGPPDGSSGPPAPRGCSCEAAPAAPWGLILLLALAWLRRLAPWR